MKIPIWAPIGAGAIALLLVIVLAFSTCGGCDSDNDKSDGQNNNGGDNDPKPPGNGNGNDNSNGVNPTPKPIPIPVVSIPFDHSYTMNEEELIKIQLFDDWTGWIRLPHYVIFQVESADSLSWLDIEFGDGRKFHKTWKNKNKVHFGNKSQNENFRLRGQGEVIVVTLGRNH